MSAVYLGEFTPSTPEWRKLRADKVGGSDVAAILGLSPWSSAYSLFHEKRGDINTEQQDKPQLEWGTRLEPVIVQAWADRHPEFVVDYAPAATYAHSDYPWAIVAPDALIRPNIEVHPLPLAGGLEAKTARWDYAWADGVPDYYDVQGQWAMFIIGVPTWNFAVLFGGSDYREFQIEARASVQEALRETASDFLDSIRQGKVPPIDGHDSTYAAVRELHPSIEDEDIEVGDAGREWVAAERAAKAALEAAKEAKARMADQLGNGRRALVDGNRVAYRKNAGAGRPPVLTAVNGLLSA